MRIQVKITGLSKLILKMRNELLFLEPVGEAVERSAIETERLARTNAPKWRNILAGSMTTELIGSPVPLIANVGPARGPVTQYAKVMEYGRRPGKQPPVAAVEAWANSKGLVPYLVARSIGKKGIKGRFYMKRTAEAVQPYIARQFERATKEIERRWSA